MKKTKKYIAADIFCGGGIGAIGLKQAGFHHVVGFDIKMPTEYQGDEFVQCDVHNLPFLNLDWADFVIASPPCQRFSVAGCGHGKDKRLSHPNLIPITRNLLRGHPYTAIENVPQAPLKKDWICWGQQFRLEKLWRKRVFELSFWLWELPKPIYRKGTYYSITKSMGCNSHFYRRKEKGLPGTLSLEEAKETMGIPQSANVTKHEIAEGIAPPITKYIGEEVIKLIEKTN